MTESVAFISLQWKHVFGFLNSQDLKEDKGSWEEVAAVSSIVPGAVVTPNSLGIHTDTRPSADTHEAFKWPSGWLRQ